MFTKKKKTGFRAPYWYQKVVLLMGYNICSSPDIPSEIAIPEALTKNIVCITMWWIAAESYEYKLISLYEVQLNESCLIRIDLLEISAELCRIIFQIAHFPPFPWQSR